MFVRVALFWLSTFAVCLSPSQVLGNQQLLHPGSANAGTGPLSPPVGFPSRGVTLLSWLTLNELGAGVTSANDCWGYVSASGREYAIIGHSHGTTFVEVTDPTNAQFVAVIAGPTSYTRDLKVYRDFTYVVADGGGGIQVIDMTQIDSGEVLELGSVASGGTHNVAIDTDSGYLYRCDGRPGLPMYSLADPANPTLVGIWNGGLVHDAQIVTYTSGPYAGRQIAFCCTATDATLVIVDVTDKQSPFVLANYPYPNGEGSHQGWLSEDRQYFYLNDELDEAHQGIPTTTHVIDVSDLTAPVQVSTFTNGNPAVDHNLYVRGDLIFEANYRSGLRVYDASGDPQAPVEIAFFDTYPQSDDPTNGGLWSNFPFYPSGIVIGSDVESGLFVWRLDSQEPQFVRSDCNQDSANNITDSIHILGILFGGGNDPSCLDACDANDDGDLNIGDPIYLLTYLFSMGHPPASPFLCRNLFILADGNRPEMFDSAFGCRRLDNKHFPGLALADRLPVMQSILSRNGAEGDQIESLSEKLLDLVDANTTPLCELVMVDKSTRPLTVEDILTPALIQNVVRAAAGDALSAGRNEIEEEDLEQAWEREVTAQSQRFSEEEAAAILGLDRQTQSRITEVRRLQA